ncbi:hypothetical protein [uncultured Corynebacterium sp.]|nr:hypothetical protein [uncultured Corynebacterium sp.]
MRSYLQRYGAPLHRRAAGATAAADSVDNPARMPVEGRKSCG